MLLHLIATLRKTTVRDSAILIPLNAVSLYTSIPINQPSRIVRFSREPRAFKRPDLTLLSILRLILSTNNFFEGHQWLQTHGVAIGKVLG